MKITTQQAGENLEVKVSGRLDGYWTDHLRSNLEELIRGGAHRVQLDLGGVDYISSSGIGLLVLIHKQLLSIDGALIIVNVTDPVKRIVEVCGLSKVLLGAAPSAARPARKAETRRLEKTGADFEITELSPNAVLRGEVLGDAGLLDKGQFGPEDSHNVAFPAAAFGLGLGAFGEGFDSAHERFGEFIAVAGSAAYLPTDGTNVPDHLVSKGTLAPEVNVLYGLRLEGSFSHQARFESTGDAGALKLSDLAETCLEISGREVVGLVIVAESSGLVGAALRRSPAMAAAGSSLFAYPEIRTWLSFSTERLFTRSLAVVCGVAARKAPPALAPLLRPLGTAEWPQGHFHAAALSYRPLKKGDMELAGTVASLFENESLQGLLHLLTDDRDAAGHEQSEFRRGACWIGSVSL
jgi:anti-anti-sigma factor